MGKQDQRLSPLVEADNWIVFSDAVLGGGQHIQHQKQILELRPHSAPAIAGECQ